MNPQREAQKYYEEKYGALKIKSGIEAKMKKIIEVAFRKGKKPEVLLAKWMERKGIEIGNKKPSLVVAEGGIQVKELDRKSLKGAIAELQNAGAKVEYSKEDTDAELAMKLSTALAKLPSSEMLAKLDKIDPDKLTVLNGPGACLGLFVDMKQVECLVCPDKQECVKTYMKNLKGDFKQFKSAMVDLRADRDAESVTDEELDAVAKSSKKKDKKSKSNRIKYDAKLPIYFVGNNPVKKSDDKYLHACIEEILEKLPETLGKLQKLVAAHYEYDSDKAFMQEFFMQLHGEGLVKLWEELTPKQQKQFKSDASSDDDEDEDDDDDDEEDDDDE